MKSVISISFRVGLILLFLLSCTFTPFQPAVAQQPDGAVFPPAHPKPVSGIHTSEQGDWTEADADLSSAAAIPQGTGGPDDFGYWWDDSAALNWIDATNGKDTGMNGDSWQQKVGPIALPFAFKFYENTYSELYIAAPGYVGFTDSGNWDDQPDIPSPNTPNNIIVPYGSIFELANSGKTNRVFYKSGGTAPNRYFVVEWYKVVGAELNGRQDDQYTFEVILYENGDIQFQYLTMTNTDGYWCGRIGIEDADGLDGLRYSDNCSGAQSNTAIRFTRPAPTARMRISPRTQGRMTHKATTETFALSIKNLGELGNDTFALTTTSPWQTQLRKANGGSLPDTNGDGQPDTGVLAVGQSATVLLDVQTPAFMHLGDHAAVTVNARSSLDANRQRSTTVHLGVAAPFLQVFSDRADNSVSALALQPFNALKRLVNAPDFNWTRDVAVTALSSGDSFYAWIHDANAPQGNWNMDVQYVQMGPDLNPRYGVRQLTANSTAFDSYNSSPAVAVAPDGSIGILWNQQLRDSSQDKYIWNIFFAVVNATGDAVVAPTSLTNHTEMVDWRWDIEHFYYPRIAATQDNRFVLAWNSYREDSDDWYDNIDYAVYASGGAVIKPVTRYSTDPTRSKDDADAPTLTTLNNGQLLLGYVSTDDGSFANALLDSAGNVVRGAVRHAADSHAYGSDSYQFPDGRIIVTSRDWSDNKPILSYMILGNNGGSVAVGPKLVNDSPSVTGDFYPSVTGDADGHAVITWMEYNSNNARLLYYMAVDSSGAVVTPPMPFLTANPNTDSPRIWSSWNGYGNAPNTAVKPMSTIMPALFVNTQSHAVGPQDGVAGFTVEVSNQGTPLAPGVTLTAQLPFSVTYAGASLPPTSVLPAATDGGSVIWNLPNLDYLSSGVLTIYTTVPSTTVGASYPVTLTINSTTESEVSNGVRVVQVVEGTPVFLPVVAR